MGLLVATTPEELEREARRLNEMIVGKTVKVIWRHRPKEIGIEFTDGTRLFADVEPEGLEMSVTGDFDEN